MEESTAIASPAILPSTPATSHSPMVAEEPSNTVTLSPEESETWKTICASQPKEMGGKGKKPSAEVIAAIKAFRAARKEFLSSLSPEKRELLQPTKPKPAKGSNQSASNDARDAAQLEALTNFAIPNASLVDIGANLQDRNSKKGIERLLQRSKAAGTGRVVLTGCSVKGSELGIKTCSWWWSKRKSLENDAVKLYATVGVHPHDSKTICEETAAGAPVSVRPSAMAKLRALSSSPFCVSLGECGLDYDRMFSPREHQMAAFEAQVSLAVELGKPLFVHLRERDAEKGEPIGAYADAAGILGRHPALRPEMVCVHCFTGDARDLESLVLRGYCVGLTGFVGMEKRARANGTLEALSAEGSIPLDRLMIETDAPFMTPDKKWLNKEIGVKGKNEPAALAAVCRAVASSMNLEVEEVAQVTTENACRFFDFANVDASIEGLDLSSIAGTE